MIQILDTTRNINDIARKQVVHIFRELLIDPDRGLALRADFVRRLKKSVQSRRNGKYKDLNDVLNRYL